MATDTAILYRRTNATLRDAATYTDLDNELISTYIPDANKILFETRMRQLEGFQRIYKAKVRSHTHINIAGNLSQKNINYGLDDFDLSIYGNFKDKSDINKLISFESAIPDVDFPNGSIGLYVPFSDFLNIDPPAKGYTLLESTTGRVSRMNDIWDFKISLRFGGMK